MLPVSGSRLGEACAAKARHVADLLHVTLAALSSNDELAKARKVPSCGTCHCSVVILFARHAARAEHYSVS